VAIRANAPESTSDRPQRCQKDKTPTTNHRPLNHPCPDFYPLKIEFVSGFAVLSVMA
jgi:hypothetical protein